MVSLPLGKRFTIDKDLQTQSNTPAPDVSKNHIQNENTQYNQNMFSVLKPQFSFKDIILNSDTYEQIQDALSFINNRDLVFNKWGLKKTHKLQNKYGINFFGPSGTGKTIAAHAVADTLDRNLLIVDYSQIESKYVGETSKNITSLFNAAIEMNAIIFFDEADALLSKRVRNMENSTDTSVNQTRSHLLLQLNNYNDIIIFATNFIENYDPAFMRRISAHIKFDLPDESSRKKLWELYIPSEMPNNADIDYLSKVYNNVTGADIQNAVLAAALRAARHNDSYVLNEYFSQAIEKISEAKIYNQQTMNNSETILNQKPI